MVHKTIHGGNHYPLFVLHKVAQHSNPLPGHQISMNVSAVKQQVLGGIQPYLAGKAAEIIIDFLGPGIIIGDHQFPGKRTGLPQFIHQMYFLGIQGPGYL